MDLARLFALAGLFLSAMLGGLYATTQAATAPMQRSTAQQLGSLEAPAVGETASVVDAPAIPTGRDIPEALLEEIASEEDVIVDTATGVVIGPLKLSVREPTVEEESAEPTRSTSPTRTTTRVARQPRTAPGPRLDADPGRNVVLTARGMIARGETMHGSCYAYLSEVFHRAGNDGWRTRSVVYEAGPNGPYANLDLIRPGDWLYIVNDPDRTPVGTHSVLFVGWEDRAQGYARTISHPGWGAGEASGRESTYYITRTYRIIRPR